MQKIATHIFIYSSLLFGVLGIVLILTSPNVGPGTGLHTFIAKLLAMTVFIILPSFALSVAGKYLRNK